MTAAGTKSLAHLQAWYAEQCNGNWEHQYGISINTLDNPGWVLKVDISETHLMNRPFTEVNARGNDNGDWWACKLNGGVFEAYAGPNNLDKIISIFIDWAGVKRDDIPETR